MYESSILENPRELSTNELIQLKYAQDKWYPKLIQTYNTSLFEMMANPFKKAILVGIIFIILFGIYAVIDYNFKLNILFNKKKINKIYIIGFFVLLIFSMGSVAMTQYKLNDNLLLFVSLTKPNANKYDYESSTVIQSKLLRDSISSGGNGGGGSFLGGILGGAVGSGLSGRRRR